jgi:hypothetical protein
MAQSNVAVAWEKLEEEMMRLEAAIQLNQAAQVKSNANLNHEREQEIQLRKERNAVSEALKQLQQLR